jgi:hypothetical protein
MPYENRSQPENSGGYIVTELLLAMRIIANLASIFIPVMESPKTIAQMAPCIFNFGLVALFVGNLSELSFSVTKNASPGVGLKP